MKNRHLILGGLLYYLSDPDDDPTPRLYIPKQLQDAVIRQYHDNNGHMGIDKTFESIKRKYYFPNLYQRVGQLRKHLCDLSNESTEEAETPSAGNGTTIISFRKTEHGYFRAIPYVTIWE